MQHFNNNKTTNWTYSENTTQSNNILKKTHKNYKTKPGISETQQKQNITNVTKRNEQHHTSDGKFQKTQTQQQKQNAPQNNNQIKSGTV